MESTVVKAEPRTHTGTRACRALRTTGRLPGVIYGHQKEPISISLPQHDVEVALNHGIRLLKVDLQGSAQSYLIKEVQHDHLDASPIHIDLARVNLDERVQVNVGIELKGIPKGVSEGGVLDLVMQEIEVDCLVTEIPDTLRPVVVDLGLGDSLLVKDLELPPGVTPLVDADEVVATVRMLAVEEEPEVAEETGEDTEEPERIGRVRKDEEGAEKP